MRVLSQKYDIEICDNPDYIFCGDFFSGEFLKYDGVRIFIGGECEWPDFNFYDYAIDLVNMELADRYLRWPFYLWRDGTRDEFELALKKHKMKNVSTNKKFCNQIVSNGMAANPFRESFYKELTKYKRVDSGGRYLNNIGYRVENKLEFQKEYKFSLAFENTSQKGYITEKIIEAWAAGTIPIYWGAPDISSEFNEKAFINCNKYANVSEIINVIREIDNDDELYQKMIREPIIDCSSNANKYLTDEILLEFFANIFTQGKEAAYRRERYAWGKAKESEKMRLLKQSYYYNVLIRIDELKKRNANITGEVDKGIHKKIVIYGKGIVGEQFLDLLKKYDYIDVAAIYDKTYAGEYYEKIPILDIEQRLINNVDCVINTVWGLKEYIIEKYYDKVKVLNIDEILK